MFRFKFNSSQLGQLTLPDNPRNIDAIDSYFQRSETYYGVNQIMQDISFTWVKDGADYIRNIINGYGAGATVAVSIEYSDNQIDWERFYFGTLELITFKDLFDSVECRLVAGDKESKFLKNIETDYKILLPSTLNLNRRNEDYSADYELLQLNYNPTTSDPLRVGRSDVIKYVVFESILQNGVVEYFKNIGFTTQLVITNNDDFPFTESIKQMLLYGIYTNSSKKTDLTLNLNDLKLNISQLGYIGAIGTISVKAQLRLAIFNNNGKFIQSYLVGESSLITGDGSTVSPSSVTFSGSVSLTGVMQEYYTAVPYITVNEVSVDPLTAFQLVFKFAKQGTIDLFAQQYKPATEHRCISMQRAFNRLAYRQMYGSHPSTDPNIITGDIFTGDFRHTVLTSGTELRQFTGGDGKMTTSFAELFKSLSNPFCLGMGIERVGVSDVVRITVDHRSKYFQPKIVWDLGEVSDLEIEFDEKFIYNALKIDYPSNDNKEAANGIYEFVSQYQYTTPCRYVENELDNTSTFRADGASIEEARNNEIIETTENQPDDNSNFMIRCRLSGSEYYISNGEEYPSLSYTGVQNSTQLVNLDMFPPLTLRFWAWWILAALENETEDIEIQRSEGGAVSFTINSITYDTNDITIAKLRQIAQEQPYPDAHGTLFEPFLYNFRAPVTAKFIQAFSANRHGVIKFTYRGSIHYGFAMRIPAMPRTDANWILLKLSKRGRSYV